MGLYNTPHPVKSYTRKMHKKTTNGPPVRTVGTRRKGIYHTMQRNTVVPVNNNSRRVKPTALSENETRNLKKAKKRAKEWPDIVAVINDLDILDLLGLYIDENRKIVSIEGEITNAEYNQLIEELRNELNPKNSGYEQKIIKKAIRFVKEERAAHAEMNSLGAMMSSTHV
jgi:hypothetical protein